jgi:hypothetical protein
MKEYIIGAELFLAFVFGVDLSWTSLTRHGDSVA